MSIPFLRFIKVPDRDLWLPSYVKKNDDLSAFYILIEFSQSTIASKLLGDVVALHSISEKPFVGAWVNQACKATWRTSPSTVPSGKALLGSTVLDIEDISEAFINDIVDPLEPPSVPQVELSASSGSAPSNEVVPNSLSAPNSSSSEGLHNHSNGVHPTMVPQPPLGYGSSPGHFEVPQFAPFAGSNDLIDATTRHYAKREANATELPNKRQFTGFNDDRSIGDLIKSVNHTSRSNGWSALEYYFFLTRLMDETVSREINPLPQQTHTACAREVMRICQLLAHLHKSSQTDYIRKLSRWNALSMGDRQTLGDYLKAFENLRLDVERQQGYPFEERFLTSKLTASLRGIHHDTALSRMKALTYRELLHELVELERVRQLSAQQRAKCGDACPKRDTVQCERCEGIQRHHTSHCPYPIARSSDPTVDTMSLSLSIESLTFTPPTSSGPTGSPTPLAIEAPVLNLDNTLQSLRDMPSSLRNVEFNFLANDGRSPGFTGLLDSGSQLLACSDSGLLRLHQANVALEPTGVTCVATLAVSRRVNSCPIYKIIYCHKGFQVQTFMAHVHGLARDFIFSCDVLRRVNNPVLWVFNSTGDRIISLADSNPQVATAWKAFLDAVELSRSAAPTPPKVNTGINSLEFDSQDNPADNTTDFEACFNKEYVLPLPFEDDIEDKPEPIELVSSPFMELLFSDPCPLVSLSALAPTDLSSASNNAAAVDIDSKATDEASENTSSPPPASSTDSYTSNKTAAVDIDSKATNHAPDESGSPPPASFTRFTHHLRWRTTSRPTNSHVPFLKRSNALAHQLRRKGLFDAYNDEIQGFVQKGYVKPVAKEEVRYWLHHFPVVKKGPQDISQARSSMRLRPVFDGSTLSGFIDPSLPEGLHQGVPQSLALLRRYRYFAGLDLVQAFLQIQLESLEDQRSLGFWWGNQAYIFLRVCFGMPDSPFAMSNSLTKAMSEANAPIKHFRCLMDDISLGSDDPEHLTGMRHDIIKQLTYRQFQTNDKKEVSNLPGKVPADTQPCLGALWYPQKDSLSLKSELRHKASHVATVKHLKRYANGFYDPLGWHLELSMQLRLLCRQARANADPSTGELQLGDINALLDWESRLKAFDLSVPRLLRRPGESHCSSVCLFTDSSDTAGAALLYTLHGQRIAGFGYLHQLQGRRTAPKFELDTLASALEWAVPMIIESNDHSPVHHLLVLTDSSISVSRLRQATPPTAHSVEDLVTVRRILKVKNAIYKLQSLCPGLRVVVSHLSGKSNLADAPSRCLPVSTAIDHESLFGHIRNFHDDLLRCNDSDLQGNPMLFRLDPHYTTATLPTKWSKKASESKVTLAALSVCPSTTPVAEDFDDELHHKAFATEEEPLHILERLYRYKLLIKAWSGFRSELLPNKPTSSSSQGCDPLQLLIRHEQHRHLDGHRKLPFHHRTEEGLLYRSTRQSADGTIYNQLVIPKQSGLLQRLLVLRCHAWHHEGINATLRRLITMYAWPRMKRTVVPVCRCCRPCLSAKPQHSLHAPAGTFVAPTAVWQYVGLDHTGPYDVPVREGSPRLPYCLVATCLLSGYQVAIAVPNTSLQQTILAFKKIIAIAGIPKGTRCDNSLSFRGPEFRCFCLSHSIEVQYIPSRSPQRGGAYERHHAELNSQLRLLQARDQPWDLTVLEATARSNARFRWDNSGPVNSPWDLAHTYPYLQCSSLSAPISPTLPPATDEPSARVSEWILSTWENDREGRRLRAGDRSAALSTGDVVYLKLPRRVTKLSSSTTGPFRVLQVYGNSVRLTPTTGPARYRSVLFQPVDNVVRTISLSTSGSDTPSGPPDTHHSPEGQNSTSKVTDEPNQDDLDDPQADEDDPKAFSPARDDADHLNETATSSPKASSPTPPCAKTSSAASAPTTTGNSACPPARPRGKRASILRRTGDSSPEPMDFAYFASTVRGGIQCGRVLSVDQGLYRLRLADRSSDGLTLHLKSDTVSTPTAFLLRVQGDSDDYPDNKIDYRLTCASARFLDNLTRAK
ncbi:hypothetical protein FOL47_006814 [Perkinsus chesapeaki]|uniref:Integrase catalytic domain-containing protein n=1 Tax=Perkinsus chesapeaki TaxID=330153 RepID=A0A7J6MX58_PERCH|nr:hypothetical protein FOL47_006814 [Perkinsus chesapeaki]